MVSSLTKTWLANVDRKAAKERARRVLHKISKHHSQAKSVLELGVGLGVVLEHFKRFRRSGLDLGEEYVRIARRIVPDAKFYVQSMHNFKIPEKFDVIFSVHECINEVNPFSSWLSTFRRAHAHLNPDGLFIFDMRTRQHLQHMKKQQVRLEETPSGYVYDNTIVKGDTLIWDTTYFRKVGKDLYRIEKDTYKERIYSEKKVEAALRRHFDILEVSHFEKGHKVLFVCRAKPQ